MAGLASTRFGGKPSLREQIANLRKTVTKKKKTAISPVSGKGAPSFNYPTSSLMGGDQTGMYGMPTYYPEPNFRSQAEFEAASQVDPELWAIKHRIERERGATSQGQRDISSYYQGAQTNISSQMNSQIAALNEAMATSSNFYDQGMERLRAALAISPEASKELQKKIGQMQQEKTDRLSSLAEELARVKGMYSSFGQEMGSEKERSLLNLGQQSELSQRQMAEQYAHTERQEPLLISQIENALRSQWEGSAAEAQQQAFENQMKLSRLDLSWQKAMQPSAGRTDTIKPSQWAAELGLVGQPASSVDWDAVGRTMAQTKQTKEVTAAQMRTQINQWKSAGLRNSQIAARVQKAGFEPYDYGIGVKALNEHMKRWETEKRSPEFIQRRVQDWGYGRSKKNLKRIFKGTNIKWKI